jgi:hypothetical protein
MRHTRRPLPVPIGMSLVGLRYFNVYGPRQDPEGPYAAVIPRWINALLRAERCRIFGDGETSRDFTSCPTSFRRIFRLPWPVTRAASITWRMVLARR